MGIKGYNRRSGSVVEIDGIYPCILANSDRGFIYDIRTNSKMEK